MFVHLHAHSWFSLGQGASCPGDLIAAAAARGFSALACTDTNGVYGAVEFQRTAVEAGIRPILGAHLVLGDEECVALAMDERGWGAICRAATAIHWKQHERSTVNGERECHSPAVQPSSRPATCLSALLAHDRDGAIILSSSIPFLERIVSHSGPADIFAELVPGKERHAVLATGRRLGLLPVVTNAVMFAHPEDHPRHRLLSAISANATLSSLEAARDERHRPSSRPAVQPSSSWLKPAAELVRHFPDVPDAIDRAGELAERCRYLIPIGQRVVPPRYVEATDALQQLRALAYQGAARRYGTIAPITRDRLEHELAIIGMKGFADYFLVVKDIVEHGPTHCGRGSVANSIVSYCLGITHVEPLGAGLLFERFLNPERKDPPDIDLDFPWDERDHILAWVFQRYPLPRAAMVANHNTLKLRGALREVAKVDGRPPAEIREVTRRIPWYSDEVPIEQLLAEHPNFTGLDLPASWQGIARRAGSLVGTPRHLSLHPGGVVIVPGALTDFVPIEPAAKRLDGASGLTVPVIQFEKDGAEDAGLVKIDLLGNRSLAVIRDGIAAVRTNTGRQLDYTSAEAGEDPETRRLFRTGNTMGVFYTESPASRALCIKSKAEDYDILVLNTSIIRPASNRFIRIYLERLHGGAWEPLDPSLRDVLSETFGVMVYQEDVVNVCSVFAGMPLASGDGLRKALSKKRPTRALAAYAEEFFAGALALGRRVETAKEVWHMVMSFAGYSFCKGHSCSYIQVAQQSGYLRAHYPAEFFAAVLANGGGFYAPFAYVAEARRAGLTVLPPDVNASGFRTTGRGAEIRIGLQFVKGLSAGASERVTDGRAERRTGGRGGYSSVEDLRERARLTDDDLRLLIKVGACDGIAWGLTRPEMLWLVDSRTSRRSGGEELVPVRPSDRPPVRLAEYGNDRRRREECDLLGFATDCHPMELRQEDLRRFRLVPATRLAEHVGRHVLAAGMLTTAKPVHTARDEPMQFATFDDGHGLIETVLFPDVHRARGHVLFDQGPFLFRGKVEEEFGALSVTVTHLDRLDRMLNKVKPLMNPRLVLLCSVLAPWLSGPLAPRAIAQGTRLLRQPTVSAAHIAFEYGGDLWIVEKGGGEARRLTSTPAMEADPQLAPDGRSLAFTSNRGGNRDVYVMPVEGGDPRQLTWHPGNDDARGWSPDGKLVLFASNRNTAPTSYARLWTVPAEGGIERLVPAPMAFRGAWSPDARRMVYDRVTRWDIEFRNYRGGQNTPLTILDLASLEETRLPNERTSDTQPVWVGQTIYFLSDRDYAVNVWAWETGKPPRQVTRFKDADVKYLAAGGGSLVIEQDGFLHTLDPATGTARKLSISVHGDFPWARPHWSDVSRSIANAALSTTGKRALFQARGEIFTVPVEKGDARNLTRSPGAADRTPVWSPDGKEVAWFSDSGKGYRLLIAGQDGLAPPREVSIGEAKFAYYAEWSPDGKRIAFVDDRSRIRVLELAGGTLTTADTDGNLLARNSIGITWSPDSKWLAYSKAFPNRFRRIVVWSVADKKATPITDALADAISPAWDRNGRHLYFLASTDLGLASGWGNISSIGRQVTRGAYIALLRATDSTPFPPQSDEEGQAAAAPSRPPAPTTPTAAPAPASPAPSAPAAPAPPITRADTASMRVDLDRIGNRILALQVPVRDYGELAAGPTGVVFLAERIPLQPGTTLHKYELSKRRAESFLTGVGQFSISGDGKKLLYQSGGNWTVTGTEAPPRPGEGRLTVALSTQLDPALEWKQIFDEAWRMERDFFYDPGLHGADWNAVYARYAPLVPYIRHRADLTYILDQVGGELSVGHSFVGGGDFPAVDSTRTGLLGADLVPDGERWKIARIYTGESWNPELRAPLDAPGLRVRAGQYILEVNGAALRTPDNPWRLLDGTAERQTVLRLNDRPVLEGSWTVTVIPLRSENALRTRAWVEDNRRKVDSLSAGRLAYVWVPNTGGGGYASFNRYFFAQQEKAGAVIDERFNGGGLLDDYMVDYMGRQAIGGVSNDAPGGVHFPLPMAGILGPKVLLVNELAGSGGDYFPWAFRELKVGPLIGTRTWGGLVASSVPYPLVDGGTITAPSAAVFGLNGEWTAEGEGIAPDIEVPLDAKSVAAGRDPQLERGVAEALKLLQQSPVKPLTLPAPSKRARRPVP